MAGSGDSVGERSRSRYVAFGHRMVSFPSNRLQVLEDCNQLLGDVAALHKEIEEKGYLFIRGLHDRDEVLAAREAVLEYIASCGDTLSRSHPLGAGVLREGCGLGCLPMMEGSSGISHASAVLTVLEGTRPKGFFKKYFKDDVRTFDYKWLRAMHREGFTGAHVDNVYMSRGSQALLTMWSPLGDVPVEMGVLAVCEGSNRLLGFKRFQETYGEMDAEKVHLQGTGWFTEDPFEITDKFGGQWKTVDYQAGDVLIFGMRTVHMSTTNTTHYARVSCDTRWQPASDPVDPRFCGGNQLANAKFGLQSRLSSGKEEEEEEEEQRKVSGTTIEQLKITWGL